MNQAAGNPAFAYYGAEKMFYDVRMGPQMIEKDGILYIVYHANQTEIYANPYIITYDTATRQYSKPVRIGDAERYAFDHHLCPILWMDALGYLHVLYNCHGFGGTHRVSVRPLDISEWRDCSVIAPSISYPHAFVRPGGEVVLFYRALGHMGYWCYVTSKDGGYSWTVPITLVDFDQNPSDDEDSWAGSYHSAVLSPDGKALHIGFTYFDERGIWKFVHPRYHRKPSVNTRYNLYYITLELDSGAVRNRNGDLLKTPFNRKEAEACKLWDSGDYLTMMPTMLVEGDGNTVSFLMPVTEETEWKCGFYYMRYDRGELRKSLITYTNTTWSGSRLYRDPSGILVAYLIIGKNDGSRYTYGAGELERWVSADNGDSWEREKSFVPVEGLLYNNPIFAESAVNSGTVLPGYLAFYGWEGPHSIQPVIDKETDIPIIHRGMAYLLDSENYL